MRCSRLVVRITFSQRTAKRVPFGERAILQGSLGATLICRSSLPLSTSQKRIVLSPWVVTSFFPSGVKANAVTLAPPTVLQERRGCPVLTSHNSKRDKLGCPAVASILPSGEKHTSRSELTAAVMV